MAEIPVAIEQALKNYILDLTQDYRLDRVIVFGSMAHGTANQESDIDLAIFSADVTADNQITIMADCWFRTAPYKLDIQPLVFPLAAYYDATNNFIQKEIIAHGIEIPIPS
jgi:hypothetical protein